MAAGKHALSEGRRQHETAYDVSSWARARGFADAMLLALMDIVVVVDRATFPIDTVAI